jgi:hypothetical protein
MANAITALVIILLYVIITIIHVPVFIACLVGFISGLYAIDIKNFVAKCLTKLKSSQKKA